MITKAYYVKPLPINTHAYICNILSKDIIYTAIGTYITTLSARASKHGKLKTSHFALQSSTADPTDTKSSRDIHSCDLNSTMRRHCFFLRQSISVDR